MRRPAYAGEGDLQGGRGRAALPRPRADARASGATCRRPRSASTSWSPPSASWTSTALIDRGLHLLRRPLRPRRPVARRALPRGRAAPRAARRAPAATRAARPRARARRLTGAPAPCRMFTPPRRGGSTAAPAPGSRRGPPGRRRRRDAAAARRARRCSRGSPRDDDDPDVRARPGRPARRRPRSAPVVAPAKITRQRLQRDRPARAGRRGRRPAAPARFRRRQGRQRPAWSGRSPRAAEVRHGDAGRRGGPDRRRTGRYRSSPCRTSRQGGSVDLVLGTGFTALLPPAEAAAALSPSPSPTPAGC